MPEKLLERVFYVVLNAVCLSPAFFFFGFEGGVFVGLVAILAEIDLKKCPKEDKANRDG